MARPWLFARARCLLSCVASCRHMNIWLFSAVYSDCEQIKAKRARAVGGAAAQLPESVLTQGISAHREPAAAHRCPGCPGLLAEGGWVSAPWPPGEEKPGGGFAPAPAGGPACPGQCCLCAARLCLRAHSPASEGEECLCGTRERRWELEI